MDLNEPGHEAEPTNPYSAPSSEANTAIPQLAPALSLPLAVILLVFIALATLLNFGLGVGLFLIAARASARRRRLPFRLSRSCLARFPAPCGRAFSSRAEELLVH